MKISVGIVGYGNLGKAVEQIVNNDPRFELAGIFSRRNLPNIKSIDDILNYKDKIDVLFLCGGSATDLEGQARMLGKHFCLVDCYDNHNKLESYIKKMDEIAKENETVYLSALGWDPGLFSLARGFFASFGETPKTFWGPGLSQGHSQAIRSLDGVLDGVQFTIPNESAIEKIKNGEDLPQSKDFHIRKCFVVAERGKERQIEEQIQNMPDYFLGYKTEVEFVNQQKLNEIKNFAHGGMVITNGGELCFSLKTKSNPMLTARIATTYATVVKKLLETEAFGSYTIFDIPPSLFLEDKFRWL